MPPGLVVEPLIVVCTVTPSVCSSIGFVSSVVTASSNSCWAIRFALAASALTCSRRELNRLSPMLIDM